MEASLGVPTATSFRDIPAKMLEANRRIINGHMKRARIGKASFTHLIAWATIRAIADHVPAMNSTYVQGPDGKPRVHRHDKIGLGVAVDVQKRDGSRTLLVPTLRDAAGTDFMGFVAKYDDLVARARINKLTLDDFGDTTVSLTNPGGIGTVQSVPSADARHKVSLLGWAPLHFPLPGRLPTLAPSPTWASPRSSRSRAPMTIASSRAPSPASSCELSTACSSASTTSTTTSSRRSACRTSRSTSTLIAPPVLATRP